jgi:hypothetical protein
MMIHTISSLNSTMVRNSGRIDIVSKGRITNTRRTNSVNLHVLGRKSSVTLVEIHTSKQSLGSTKRMAVMMNMRNLIQFIIYKIYLPSDHDFVIREGGELILHNREIRTNNFIVRSQKAYRRVANVRLAV